MQNLERAFCALFVVVILFACKPNNPEVLKAIEQVEGMPILSMKDLESTISDSGKIKYRIRTPELMEYDHKSEPYMEFPQGLAITSFNDKMEIAADIKGNYAKYFKKMGLWELKNDVQAKNFEGSLINTEELYWDSKKKRIYSDKFIKITSKREVITGVGFESNEDFSKYKILKVNGIIEIEE